MYNKSDKANELKARIHLLESELNHYVKRSKQLEALLKGAISTEYGAFLRLGSDILYGLDGNLPKEWFYSRTLIVLREYLGTDKRLGLLAKEINQDYCGIIDSMSKDYPDFGPYEKNLFCSMVLKVKNNVIMHVFDLGTDQKTAGEKTRLIKRIWALRKRARVKYVRLLEKE